ncbi:MAG TPA: 3-oxoacyl-[acyl-carrier-protein] synthase III C-terminal domain-containing protein [Chthoniobacterales bacterium]|jgi:3-oxoacyl-[acyl-carrier-protein] synthase-3
MKSAVGILSASCQVPKAKCSVEDLFREEGANYSPEIAARLGIKQVHLQKGAVNETASNMAVAAGREALERAKVDPQTVKVVVEYSIMPQEYLVPVWNMSNKVQAEVGAAKSFVVGFSGGGSSNFMVALTSAAAMLSENEELKTALLVTGDTTIPGNRVLNPEDPVTVLGDGASAVVLQRGAPGSVVIDTQLWSNGANHDVCYIPGGSLAHPDNIDLYRMQLDKARYDSSLKPETLRRISDELLTRAGLSLSDVACVLCSNISAQDEAELQKNFENKVSQVCATNRELHGHLQGSDFPLNYLSLVESGKVKQNDYILAVSHGMGATAATTLLRY